MGEFTRVKGSLSVIADLERKEIMLIAFKEEEPLFAFILDAGTAECLIQHLAYILGKYFSEPPEDWEPPECEIVDHRIKR